MIGDRDITSGELKLETGWSGEDWRRGDFFYTGVCGGG